jgi:hypothetical protein
VTEQNCLCAVLSKHPSEPYIACLCPSMPAPPHVCTSRGYTLLPDDAVAHAAHKYATTTDGPLQQYKRSVYQRCSTRSGRKWQEVAQRKCYYHKCCCYHSSTAVSGAAGRHCWVAAPTAHAQIPSSTKIHRCHASRSSAQTDCRPNLDACNFLNMSVKDGRQYCTSHLQPSPIYGRNWVSL